MNVAPMREVTLHSGFVLAYWNDAEQVGEVRALGLTLTRPRRLSCSIDVDVLWRPVENYRIFPNPQARHNWRSDRCFKFPQDRADRYAFADKFCEYFPDYAGYSFDPPPDNSVHGSNRRGQTTSLSKAAATPGFIYLLRSDYGIKIGKAVNLRNRAKIFGVKLPFKWTVEHYAWFDDYSSAERTFHEQFRNKRGEGEWFNLSGEDIYAIKQIGSPPPDPSLVDFSGLKRISS